MVLRTKLMVLKIWGHGCACHLNWSEGRKVIISLVHYYHCLHLGDNCKGTFAPVRMRELLPRCQLRKRPGGFPRIALRGRKVIHAWPTDQLRGTRYNLPVSKNHSVLVNLQVSWEGKAAAFRYTRPFWAHYPVNCLQACKPYSKLWVALNLWSCYGVALASICRVMFCMHAWW